MNGLVIENFDSYREYLCNFFKNNRKNIREIFKMFNIKFNNNRERIQAYGKLANMYLYKLDKQDLGIDDFEYFLFDVFMPKAFRKISNDSELRKKFTNEIYIFISEKAKI